MLCRIKSGRFSSETLQLANRRYRTVKRKEERDEGKEWKLAAQRCMLKEVE